MKEIRDFRLVLFVVLLAFVIGVVDGANAPYMGPYIQDAKGDSITIMWVTNGSETSRVEYKNENSFSDH